MKDMNKDQANDYEAYLDRYCKIYNVSREAAETHAIVKLVKEHCRKELIGKAY